MTRWDRKRWVGAVRPEDQAEANAIAASVSGHYDNYYGPGLFSIPVIRDVDPPETDPRRYCCIVTLDPDGKERILTAFRNAWVAQGGWQSKITYVEVDAHGVSERQAFQGLLDVSNWKLKETAEQS